MKVIVKFHSRTVIVENVSVDEKCFPLVGGVHPYPEASQQDSHLANQSSIWFKTLAIDCVFVNCDSSEVHWFPVVNDVNPDVGVILRKARPDRYESSFILSVAKPLFEDSALYEMDPSLKGMMLTCSEAMRKLCNKKMAKADFNRAIASILHVYILPSIVFSPDDLYCLSRARCLIEDRLNNSENMIKCVVESIDRLETCLTTLRSNLLYRENLESENYLRTCNPNFLQVFLKNLEDVLVHLNLSLETQQSKVNWAKQHEGDSTNIHELKSERDEIYSEVVRLIRVRESIRNVTTRKEFVSPKNSKRRKKSVVVASCFHDVFVEVVRRLEVENKTLERLCQDKLNISACREATMAAIMQLENNNRVSERTTKFEPEEFVDYSINVESGTKKSDLWPTFQERVITILENSSSKSHCAHVEGCKALSYRIDLALSEYNLAILGSTGEDKAESSNTQQSSGVETVQMRNSPASKRSKRMRSTVCTYKDGILIHEATFRPTSSTLDDTRAELRGDSEPAAKHESLVVNSGEEKQDAETEGSDKDDFEPVPNLQRNRYQKGVNEKLALSALLQAVNELKHEMQAHFREVVGCLSQELGAEHGFSLDIADQKELLWKSYERVFMKNEVDRLNTLYETLLKPGTQRTYEMLSANPLQTLLGEDKILQLFYGRRDSSAPLDCTHQAGSLALEPDHFSMSRTLSELSVDVRHCPIEELYTLANADSSDILRRFHLESSGEENQPPSSGSSSSSVKAADDTRGSSPTPQIQDTSVAFSAEESGASPLTHWPPSADLAHGEIEKNVDKDGAVSPDQVLMLPGVSEVNPPQPSTSQPNQNESSSLSSFLSSTSLNAEEEEAALRVPVSFRREVSNTSSQVVLSRLDSVLSPFRKSVCKCLEAASLLDKMRYIGRAIQGLHRQVWQLLGEGEHASCDDIISMLVVALCHMSEDIFIRLYVNVRMLMDIWPSFLDGTLWNCSLVNLYACYDFLFTHNVCEKVLRDFSGSLRVKF